jgi:hypothetical protein
MKLSSIINWIPTVLLLAGVVFIIFKIKDNEEPYYPLKVIGYYLLGAFRFSFNRTHIPLGYIVFLLILRDPQKNQRGKRYAATLGLIAFAAALIIPGISKLYYERTRYIEPVTADIYQFDFLSHWNAVAEALELDEYSIGSARVENLNIDYKKDGAIERLTYEITWGENGQLRHASVDFNEAQKRIGVRAMKISQWLQYDRIISADRLFKKLNQINIKELTPKEDFAYYGLSFYGEANFGVTNEEVFIIEDNRIVPFKGELPVKGYWIKTFGMEQTGEHSYSSTHGQNYLFDVQHK